MICLFDCFRDSAPGQKECDDSLEILNKQVRNLDQASLAAISQSLPQQREKSLKVSVSPSATSNPLGVTWNLKVLAKMCLILTDVEYEIYGTPNPG